MLIIRNKIWVFGSPLYMEGCISPLGHYKTNTRVFECSQGAKKNIYYFIPTRRSRPQIFNYSSPRFGQWASSYFVRIFFPGFCIHSCVCGKALCDMAALQLGVDFWQFVKVHCCVCSCFIFQTINLLSKSLIWIEFEYRFSRIVVFRTGKSIDIRARFSSSFIEYFYTILFRMNNKTAKIVKFV